jgi:hypothetical protein
MPGKIELTGRRFGSLVVVCESAKRKERRRSAIWLCRCDCGDEYLAVGTDLRSGKTHRCINCAFRARKKHGMSYSPEHRSWGSMRQRCTNPRHREWDRYGGRGIKICQRWLDSFEAFYEDMGPRPSLDHSIDRIDNDGDYSPENCRWATWEEQNSNQSQNVFLEWQGETLCMAAAARAAGLDPARVSQRRRAGWPQDLWLAPLGTRRR